MLCLTKDKWIMEITIRGIDMGLLGKILVGAAKAVIAADVASGGKVSDSVKSKSEQKNNQKWSAVKK